MLVRSNASRAARCRRSWRPMTAAESIFSLCQHPLVSADSDGSAPQALSSLMCGCTFHAECITAFCDQAHTTVLEMRCPVCRQTADAVATLEATATQNLKQMEMSARSTVSLSSNLRSENLFYIDELILISTMFARIKLHSIYIYYNH